MITMTAYKFRLEPSIDQEKEFESWAGTCRFLYNLCLEHRILSWQQYRKSQNYYDQANELKNLKQIEGFEWIKNTPSQVLQQTLKDLDKAYKSFFKSSFGFPKFKKKGIKDSFRFPDPKQFSVRKVSKKKGEVKLPKIGNIKFRLSREIVGEIKNATIKKESGKWFISFCAEIEEVNTSNFLDTRTSVGIDRGIRESFRLSDDLGNSKFFNLPDELKTHFSKIKIIQKRLRKKKKFSNNWKKEIVKINKLHSKIARSRQDFLHKTTSELVKSHNFVTLEDLKIKNMSKSGRGTVEKPGKMVAQKSGLNREILFQGWGIFTLLLKYKLERSGGYLELVNPKFTSTRCSKCLFNDKANRKQKMFCCLNCGFSEDADINASINILRAGHARSGRGDVGVGPIDEAATALV